MSLNSSGNIPTFVKKMQGYFVVVFLIGLCNGYSSGIEEDILGLPVLDYDDPRNYDPIWEAQNNIWRQEKVQEQKPEWDVIFKKLCENNDFTLGDKPINCEKIKIKPKVNKSDIKKRDVSDVLEEGSGDDAPVDHQIEENKEYEQSVPVVSSPVEQAKKESEPVHSESANSVPEKLITIPIESIPPDSVTPAESTPLEAIPVKVPVEAVPPVEAPPHVETVPQVEAVLGAKAEPIAPLETVSVDTAPIYVDTTASNKALTEASLAVSTAVAPIDLNPAKTNTIDLEYPVTSVKVAPIVSVITESVLKSAIPDDKSKSAPEATEAKAKEEEKPESSDKGSGLLENEHIENKKKLDVNEKRLSQEEINDKQSGVAVYNIDSDLRETEDKLNTLKTNENIKTASIGGIGESSERNTGRNDNKILVTLFVAVLAVGVAAFSYHYIKKKKRTNNTSSRNGVVKCDVEEGTEMKPLMKVPEESSKVEIKNEKEENVTA
ncbi:uncharacterized protein isoform X1 [Leptinotarsa decemlineata]|uniref:uncharacterized protein isoform X1 n=1 Tax=Leptinotarsa decemlineata TaxID=7539 RepID=UPI003D30A68C